MVVLYLESIIVPRWIWCDWMLKDATCKCLPKRKGSYLELLWMNFKTKVYECYRRFVVRQTTEQESSDVLLKWSGMKSEIFHLSFSVACPTWLFFSYESPRVLPRAPEIGGFAHQFFVSLTFIVKWTYFLRLTEGWLEELGGFTDHRFANFPRYLKQQHAQG